MRHERWERVTRETDPVAIPVSSWFKFSLTMWVIDGTLENMSPNATGSAASAASAYLSHCESVFVKWSITFSRNVLSSCSWAFKQSAWQKLSGPENNSCSSQKISAKGRVELVYREFLLCLEDIQCIPDLFPMYDPILRRSYAVLY
jgi:hypothetical protein